MKAGEGEGREERNLKPAARCLAAIREVNRTCTGVSHTATEHQSKEIITRWHGEAGAVAPSPLGMLVALRERAGGGTGAASGLRSPRGQSQEETDADKSPDSHVASRRFWHRVQPVECSAGPRGRPQGAQWAQQLSQSCVGKLSWVSPAQGAQAACPEQRNPES